MSQLTIDALRAIDRQTHEVGGEGLMAGMRTALVVVKAVEVVTVMTKMRMLTGSRR